MGWLTDNECLLLNGMAVGAESRAEYEAVKAIIARSDAWGPVVCEIATRQCQWTYNEHHDCWHTSCDEDFCVVEGSPHGNGMDYCPYCGGEIDEMQVETNDEMD